ncbi:hypothetical protein Pve01_94890 [Planomonospora venezuelensis]|nr:hypothetical protein Pve01_94890 [Planomonospora venezuelensis]
MSPELWALGGVVVGALLTTAGQIVNAVLQRKWSKEDRDADLDREREQRLFDHRRVAYTEFLAEFESHESALFSLLWDDQPFPDADAYLRPLSTKASSVRLYGTSEAALKAHALVLQLGKWADAPGNEEADLRDQMGLIKQEYLSAARADLGVIDPPGMIARLRAEDQESSDPA